MKNIVIMTTGALLLSACGTFGDRYTCTNDLKDECAPYAEERTVQTLEKMPVPAFPVPTKETYEPIAPQPMQKAAPVDDTPIMTKAAEPSYIKGMIH